jgi:hypothetical protein
MFLAPPFPGTFQVWRFELKKSICAQISFYYTLETRNLVAHYFHTTKAAAPCFKKLCKGTKKC